MSVPLRNGANPNLRDGGGETPLDRAADWGYRSPAIVEAAALHISHGAQVDARGSNGGTALHWAANMGSAEMVQLLLRSGAEVDAWTNVSKGKVEPNFLGKIPHQELPLLGEAVQVLTPEPDAFFQYSIAEIEDEYITEEELHSHIARMAERPPGDRDRRGIRR
ncbi:ankyrin repeat domain-containing protein [Nocardioides sp. GY 10127]|uniref:ankyrin repeat domain-containing protein n=1 Tax=Nocardioides sp. GY 10127 TaxID=2569762 RepID=UPI0014583223|nr:ankyrin repeat domain-containing protein [Nocardioides sp. GY 10127]